MITTGPISVQALGCQYDPQVFCGQKKVLERFTSMRSLYTLALLRDLSRRIGPDRAS